LQATPVKGKDPKATAGIMHEVEERQHISNSNFHPIDGDFFWG
jgi:hypothetical protein